MENHSGYQRQLIIARLTRVNECLGENTSTTGNEMTDETRRLVIEFERLVAVALSGGLTRNDFAELYGLDEVDQDGIIHDRMSESSVEAVIKAREDSLFDALVALVPEKIPTE